MALPEFFEEGHLHFAPQHRKIQVHVMSNVPLPKWMETVAPLFEKAPVGDLPVEPRGNYAKISDPGFRGVVQRKWRDRIGSVGKLLSSIERDPGEVLREGGGQGLMCIRDVGGIRAYCKVYRAQEFRRKVRDAFGISRTRREWESCMKAQEAGVHVARILLAGTRRDGLRATHLIVSEPIPGVSAAKILRRLSDTPELRDDFLRTLGAYVASLHARGFLHAHLHCKHIFLTRAGEPVLLDLERSRLSSRPSQAARAKNLRQMEKSFARELDDPDPAPFREGYKARITPP